MLALFIIAIALQHTTAPARHGFNGINLTDVQRATGNATYSMEENTSMSSGPSMLSEGIKKIYSSGFSTSKNLSQDSTIPQTISASVFFMSSQNAANALTYSLVASDSLVNGNAGTGEGSPTYNYTYMNDTVQIFLPFDILVYCRQPTPFCIKRLKPIRDAFQRDNRQRKTIRHAQAFILVFSNKLMLVGCQILSF